MPKMVYNNIEDQRMYDADTVVEDVTSVKLPTISHPSNEIHASGMAGTIDMPNLTKLEAMSYSIAHNNGLNCEVLAEPRVHQQELRVARQRYNVATGQVDLVSMKVRLTGIHKSTDKGSIESENPYGSTDEYSCTRYEEELDGKIVTLIDIMAHKLLWNGRDYSQDISKFLD